jgi:hypothetical protein
MTIQTTHRPRRILIGVAAVLSLAASLVPAGIATADSGGGACTLPTSHNSTAYQTYAIQNATPQPTGVRATISEYDPYYTGSNHAGTNQSVFLTYRPPSGSMAWSQFGWAKWRYRTNGGSDGPTKRQVFLEMYYNNGANNIFQMWTDSAIGLNREYKILYGSGGYSFYVNGGLYYSSGSVPYGPTTADIESETHDQADQMPGGTGNSAVFSGANYTIYPSWQSWSAFTAGIASNATWGGRSKIGSTYYVWDTRCSL